MKRTLKLRAQGDLAKVTIRATIEGGPTISREELGQLRSDLRDRLFQALPGTRYAGIMFMDVQEVG